ncbi:unnamed protein product (mitochondrion) [Plasmodiophora brassicae]|uniref:phenylalanine 4-monooxygenase n=1 Tax=Plasmodiophora brassicae TaxID=37360 RepID=A0A3P3YBG0_PLABS|nr:unnamed protein product [Plasmodiophora brassicae]
MRPGWRLPSMAWGRAARLAATLGGSADIGKVSAVFSVSDRPGALQTALQFFWKNDVNMTRIESRPSKFTNDYDFYVDFDGDAKDDRVKKLVADLKSCCRSVMLIGGRKVPWFPRRVTDMDLIVQTVLDAGDELESDHPGFHDQAYRDRRARITQAAAAYKHGEPIARIDYSQEEVGTWGLVWDKLRPLLQQHACEEYTDILDGMEAQCGYARDSIPQLEDISQFLQKRTGFRLRPVAGLLSPRDFFSGLAFRVFYSTQYIRHHSKPLYTPEPDVVHELMGHAPMFANAAFADFSQEIGMASIGASEEQITMLARCYWFTVEFGLCQQDGQRKAYGAGLLSSFGELEYAMSDKPAILPWDPYVAAQTEYPITTYQPTYFLASSFDDATAKMRDFADSLPRPFQVRYNAMTQALEVDRNIQVDNPAPAMS